MEARVFKTKREAMAAAKQLTHQARVPIGNGFGGPGYNIGKHPKYPRKFGVLKIGGPEDLKVWKAIGWELQKWRLRG